MAEILGTAPAPLLVDAKAASALCGVSRSTWWGLHASGRCPLPVRLPGTRRTLWRRAELVAWVQADCPPRDRWRAMKGARS